MQKDALREISHVAAQGFNPILNELSNPTKWFTQFMSAGFEIERNNNWGTYLIVMNNLPTWVFIIPSTLYMLYIGIKEQKMNHLVIALSFWLIYMPFLFVNRPIFLYSSLPLLPFGFLAIGFSAERLLKKWAYVFLLVSILWCIFIYPLVVSISIPIDLYQPLLHHIRIFRPH